jgi:hypothetical protein
MDISNNQNSGYQTSTLIPDKTIEKNSALDLFTSGLVDLLDSESDSLFELIDDYNGILMLLMAEDQKFKKDLENALYSSAEELTKNEIIISDKNARPTIANWIKDFISYYGSAIFDNLVVSKYMTFSENAKKLEREEKNSLIKLLKLYRNLKFFPESLKGVPESEWQIIPIERNKFMRVGAERKETVIYPEEEQEEQGGEDVSKPAEPEPEKPPIKSDKELMLETLEKMSAKYAPGTLQRRAVEEEIRKLKL